MNPLSSQNKYGIGNRNSRTSYLNNRMNGFKNSPFSKINSGVNNFLTRTYGTTGAVSPEKKPVFPTPTGQKIPIFPTPTGGAVSSIAKETPKNQFVQSLATNVKSSTASVPPVSEIPAPQTPIMQPIEAPTTQLASQNNDYLSYLKSVYTPESVESARTRYIDAMKRLSDIQQKQEEAQVAARRGYESELDRVGGSLSGARESASRLGREDEQALADIALQESAALRAAELASTDYENLLSQGKEMYDLSQEGEGFTLGKDQVRYDAQGNPIAYGSSQFQTGTGDYTSDPTVSAWTNYLRTGGKITDVPEEYQAAVLQASQAMGKPTSETSKKAIALIDSIIGGGKMGAIFGPIQGITGGLFGEAKLTKDQYKQLKSLLQLGNIQYLKGTGAISDAEQRILEKASLALTRTSSDAVAKKVLTDLKAELSGENNQTQNITQDEIDYLRSQGYSEEEIQSLSFNTGGSDPSNAQAIANAIKSVESSGNYNARGGSGESGAYQFMPVTWKSWAGEILGNPNAPMTQQNQDKVAVTKINQWLQQGYTPQEVALLWNSGTTTPRKGVNKYGVSYDSGAYANKVLKQLYG